MPKSRYELDDIRCPHCGSKNPPKAYCCLSCFAEFRPKKKGSFWKIPIRPRTAVVIIAIWLLSNVFFVMKRWVAALEAQIASNLEVVEYQNAVLANRKQEKASLEENSERISSPLNPLPSESL